MNNNKLTTTKNNDNKGKTNELKCKCNLSNEDIYNNGICLNIKNNGKKYIKDNYLEHQIFSELEISKSYKIDLLTLVYLGCKLKNKNDIELVKFDFDNNQQPTYIITLKNGLTIYIYNNDASSKKHFNILKKYKTSIKTITCLLLNNKYYELNNFIVFYPPYLKKKREYFLGLSYDPDTKKSVVKYW